MRRFLVLLLLPLTLGACKKGHPISLYVADGFHATQEGDAERLTFEKIAVFPFLSALHGADDPDGLAPATMSKYFVAELSTRNDYKFIASNTVVYAVEREGWQDEYARFLERFARTDKADPEFLKKLAGAVQCDAFLVPVVDLWQKDEVDVEESATAATYVGATLTILDGTRSPGSILFRATDEDYAEGAQSDAESRTLVRSGGVVRSDPGGRAYAAPPYEDVAPRVIRALVASLPIR